MKIHDEPWKVTVTDEGGATARAIRCPVLADHWWLVELRGERDHAARCVEHLLGHLGGRHAVQVNVDPGEVRGDLERPFYASTGFQNDVADLRGQYPMLWRPSAV